MLLSTPKPVREENSLSNGHTKEENIFITYLMVGNHPNSNKGHDMENKTK